MDGCRFVLDSQWTVAVAAVIAMALCANWSLNAIACAPNFVTTNAVQSTSAVRIELEPDQADMVDS